MKVVWLTDVHLNFVDVDARMAFYQKLVDTAADWFVIAGDIAEAPSICDSLKEMAIHLDKPIYFVLGNHDYYFGQIDAVRKEIVALCQTEKLLHWLPEVGPQALGEDVVLLGVDGWADGRYGDYANSSVRLNDSRMIQDLYHSSILGKYQLLDTMQQWADKDAGKLRLDLEEAITQHHPKKMVVVTHVPPFEEACFYEGKKSGDDFLPFFATKSTGDVLLKAAKKHPDIEFLVLCGHTHHEAYYEPCDNLVVKVGQAEYTAPEIQAVMRF